MSATISLRRLHIEADNRCEAVFAAEGLRVSRLYHRARLREMRRWNAYLNATGPHKMLRPYAPEHFAAVERELKECVR